jgi:hypothetical protein
MDICAHRWAALKWVGGKDDRVNQEAAVADLRRKKALP